MIREEDDRVLNGTEGRSVRTMSTAQYDQYIARKEVVITGKADEKRKHILGVVSPLFFSGRFAELLDKIPQCVSVKRFFPACRGSDGEFRIVWANRRFLERHKREDIGGILGKSDFDLWPRHQAEAFRAIDRIALSIGEELERSEAWREATTAARWQMTMSTLKSRGCWEFREVQQGANANAVLQTTKWAENVYGSWFVVVIYSDVTKGDAEQRRYHDMTVHSIRNAFLPVEIAIEHLNTYFANDGMNRGELLDARKCLRDATVNINWFLEHQLEVLRMEVSLQKHRISELLEMLTAELDKATRSFGAVLNVNITSECRDAHETYVRCDLAFITAVCAEMIRNAQKAVKRRRELYRHIEKKELTHEIATQELGWLTTCGNYTPSIRVNLSVKRAFLFITIADNGCGCANRIDRKNVEELIKKAKSDPFDVQILRLGLPFCVIVVEQRHNGVIRLDVVELQETRFQIKIPLMGDKNATEDIAL